MTAAAAEGRFELQVCQRCQAVQYPPRDACHRCLSPRLKWTRADRRRRAAQRDRAPPQQRPVLSRAAAVAARPRAPRRRADGDRAPARRRRFARAAGSRSRVQVGARLDRAGAAVLIGFPPEESEHMADDKMLREMTSDPKFRKILVTDGKTEVGQALVKALVKAGAEIVWVGHAEPWKKLPRARRHQRAEAGDAGAARPDQRPLGQRAGRRDRRQGRHRRQQRRGASRLRHRARGAAPTSAKAEMDINYFGLLRLAQEFGPALKAARPTARRTPPRGSTCSRSTRSRTTRRTARSRRRRRRRTRSRSACAPRCGRPASA